MGFNAARSAIADRLIALGIFLGLFPFAAMLLICAAIIAVYEFKHPHKASNNLLLRPKADNLEFS